MKFWKRPSRAASINFAQPPQDQQAARWLARAELGLLRRDEMAQFRHWREAPDNAAALAELEAMLSEVRSSASKPGIVSMRTETLARPAREPRLLHYVPAGIAAAALVLLLLLAAVWQKSDRLEGFIGSESGMHAYRAYATRKGERRTIPLADGSTLILNTASLAEVSLGYRERHVRLVRGQALFRVARDRARPFTVTAGLLEVRALGTQFDVRIDRQSARVVLVEGQVRVEPLAHRGIGRLLPVLDRHYLKPGQQLIARHRDDFAVGAADVEQSTSWQRGRIVFRGESLKNAIAEFNRYGERQLEIADPSLGRLPVSGVFSTSRPENFLIAVSSFYPVEIEEQSAQLTVLRLRK